MTAMDYDSDPIRIKGVGSNLWVSLDTTLPEAVLRDELERAFCRIENVAHNAQVILDPGQDTGHETLIHSLGTFLMTRFGVKSAEAPPKKRSAQEEQARQRDMTRSWRHHRSDALVLGGRVRSGQRIEAKRHLVLLGDVNPGGEAVAGGDILILGSLCGIASAGQPDDEDAVVFALDFRPTQVQIAHVVLAGLGSSPGSHPECARMKNGDIVVEDYLTNNPFSKLPWPRVR